MPERVHFYMPAITARAGDNSWSLPLRTALPEARFVELTDAASFYAALPEMEYLLAFRPPQGRWPEARRLRLLQAAGAGIDHLQPLDGLPPGVRVANSSGLSDEPMAEYGLALVLMALKRIPVALEAQKSHHWERYTPGRVAGSRLLILGCGKIGQALARKATALGMHVEGTQRSPKAAEGVAEMHPATATAGLVGSADVVLSLVPLTPWSRNAVDESMLRAMKPGSTFINLGRGGTVDEAALMRVLGDGHLGWAVLDVCEQEPLPADSPLWETPNLIVTPHCSGVFDDYLGSVLPLFAENVRRVERGEQPKTLVDPGAGY